MNIRIVDKFTPRSFTAISHDGGIVLCEKEKGAFILLRYAEDIEALKSLLNSLTITKTFGGNEEDEKP